MALPALFSSLIIASSTFIVLLFAVFTFVIKEHNSKWVIFFIISSIALITSTNILTVIAFYKSELEIESYIVYPLITYILGLIAFVLSGIYLILEKYAKIR